jgi:hypothetical protein
VEKAEAVKRAFVLGSDSADALQVIGFATACLCDALGPLCTCNPRILRYLDGRAGSARLGCVLLRQIMIIMIARLSLGSGGERLADEKNMEHVAGDTAHKECEKDPEGEFENEMRHDGGLASHFRLIARVPAGENSDSQGNEHPEPIMLDDDPAILEVPEVFHRSAYLN